MPTFTVPKTGIAKGPGTLFWAPPGTALPDYTVVNSVWSVNAWTGWFQWGITKAGSDFKYEVNSDPIQAAEYLDDLDQADTGRVCTIKFGLMKIDATNLVRALNRPTPATSGSGTTLRTTVKAPGLGASLHCMIGWQSTDDQERIVGQDALQIGSLSIPRRKGADVAVLEVEFKLFPDSNGDPFLWDFAGAGRG